MSGSRRWVQARARRSCGERHVEAVARRELMRVLDDDADAARERDVVQDEADLHAPEPARALALERSRGEEGEIGLALLLPAGAGARAGRPRVAPARRSRGPSQRGPNAARKWLGTRAAESRARTSTASAPPPATAMHEPLTRELRRGDVIVGQQPPQLLEGALAPHRQVERVVHRPERVVRHAEHDVGVAACRLVAEPADEPHRVREVLDGLHHVIATRPPSSRPDRRLERRQAVVRAEVGDQRARLELAQRPCGGGDRRLVDVREQHRPRRLRELREEQARRVAGAAGGVDPQVGAGQQRRRRSRSGPRAR